MAKTLTRDSSVSDVSAGNGTNGVPVISFAHLQTAMAMPNLLDVQREAFEALLELDTEEGEGRDFGLERVFNEIFPSADSKQNFLLEYVSLPPTPCERSEALEQLRALEHGYPIRVAVVEGWQSLAVDVPADVPLVEAMLGQREQARA